MKKNILLLLCALIVCFGCKSIAAPDFLGTAHTASYMNWQDARRVALALHTTEDRKPVKWQNPTTGYQYSAFIFGTHQYEDIRQRDITLLTVSPQGFGESLDLVGKTRGHGVWHVFARKKASAIGKVAREKLTPDALPTTAQQEFLGYPVLRE